MSETNRIVMWRDETRPNTDVSFWSQNPEQQAYVESTYKNAGLLLSDEVSISEDQLTQTRTQTWARVPGIVSTVRADESLTQQAAENIAHNQANGITRSSLQYEIIDANGTVLVSGNIAE
jgi:hypothetical protein